MDLLKNIALDGNKKKSGSSSKVKPVVKFDAAYFISKGVNKKEAEELAKVTETQMLQYAKLSQEKDTLEAELGMISATLKTYCKDEFCKKYEDEKQRPESFEIASSTDKVNGMFLAIDKYAMVKSKEDADKLKAEFGNDIVEETTIISFTEHFGRKYEKEIVEFITKSKKIDDADRGKAISAQTSYCVKKGSLDKLNTFGKTVVEVFSAIQPQTQLKNVRIK